MDHPDLSTPQQFSTCFEFAFPSGSGVKSSFSYEVCIAQCNIYFRAFSQRPVKPSHLERRSSSVCNVYLYRSMPVTIDAFQLTIKYLLTFSKITFDEMAVANFFVPFTRKSHQFCPPWINLASGCGDGKKPNLTICYVTIFAPEDDAFPCGVHVGKYLQKAPNEKSYYLKQNRFDYFI